MSLHVDQLYTELYAIAGHVGPLDEEAVKSATAILALPRYVDQGGATLLVEDLKRVIGDIPADTRPEREEEAPWASRYFRSYARRFFSLDGSGETLEHRRSFGRGKLKGTLLTWMRLGVVYRVVAGLLALWNEASDMQPTQVENVPAVGYRIGAVRVTGYEIHRRKIEYQVRLLAAGPHILFSPFSFKYDNLAIAVEEPTASWLKPQLVSLGDAEKDVAVVVFGAQQKPDETVHITIDRTPRFLEASQPWVGYKVEQPIEHLTLEWLPKPLPDEFDWKVTVTEPGDSESRLIEEPTTHVWECEHPIVGAFYQLHAIRLVGRERVLRQRLERSRELARRLDKNA